MARGLSQTRLCSPLCQPTLLRPSLPPLLSTLAPPHRAKLSDMGLSKRLAAEQLSFESVGSGGSSGWQAPEQLISRSGGTARQTSSGALRAGAVPALGAGCIRGQLGATCLAAPALLRRSPACLYPARPRSALPPTPTALPPETVDVFSFGLLLHYCLTAGRHPFGELYERDANILQRRLTLKHAGHLPEAVNLIRGCCEPAGARLLWRRQRLSIAACGWGPRPASAACWNGELHPPSADPASPFPSPPAPSAPPRPRRPPADAQRAGAPAVVAAAAAPVLPHCRVGPG